MALQGPFFGKRDSGGLAPSPAPSSPKPMGGASALGSAGTSAQPFATPAATPAQPAAAPASSAAPDQNAATLTVGRNIKLKGVEITDCDTLVVEGQVEATMKSRVVQITDSGSFKGSVEVKIAEVHGEFDGDLTATDKLVIFSTGKVTGQIKYGKIIIEEGGELAGDIQSTATSKDSASKSGSSTSKTASKSA